jgi:diguanylate cyclase (GGDEF)-like protein
MYYMAVKTDISKEKDYLNRLEYISKHDDLTGLYRRGTFINLVEESLLTKFSVNKFFISVDIDNFKNINDIYGHMTGDEALILFSKSITEIFNENSYICRFGGDEFSLYIYDKTVSEINDLFKQLFEKLAVTPVKTSKKEIYISVSVGDNMIDNGDSFQVIYEKSDMLLYETKKIKGSSIKKDF